MNRDDTILLAVASVLNERLAAFSEQLQAVATRTAELDAKLMIIPAGKDGKDGVNGRNGLDGKDGVDGKDGKDGIDGKDGAPGKDGLSGKDGKDGLDGAQGKDGPAGKDGQDGVNGKDGAPGRDGLDGKDGQDGVIGKDGKDGRDGKDGEDGKDGLLTEAEPWVAGRQYQRGTVVTHVGGTWQAKCNTLEEPSGVGEWRCLAAGISSTQFEQDADNLRKAVLKLMLSDGQTIEHPIRFQVPIHMGKWEPTRTYQMNDECAWDGGSWRAAHETMGEEPGSNGSWLSVSKRGNKGSAGRDGIDGRPGKDGKDGLNGLDGVRGQDGAAGQAAVLGNFKGEYSVADRSTYQKGDVVSRGLALWIVDSDAPDTDPNQIDGAWKLLLTAARG